MSWSTNCFASSPTASRASQFEAGSLVDGSRIVTTATDGSASLWDSATADLLGTVLLPERVSAAADFASNGHTVVIATDHGSVYLWDISVSHASRLACKLAGREFTMVGWEEAFGNRTYQEPCPGI
jgi:WD40 repeat protein